MELFDENFMRFSKICIIHLKAFKGLLKVFLFLCKAIYITLPVSK
jgi:hypothetical protein